MISAKDALLLTNSVATEKAKTQLQKCQDAITGAAQIGKRTCNIYGVELLQSVAKELCDLGYSVSQDYNPDPREGGYTTTISW